MNPLHIDACIMVAAFAIACWAGTFGWMLYTWVENEQADEATICERVIISTFPTLASLFLFGVAISLTTLFIQNA